MTPTYSQLDTDDDAIGDACDECNADPQNDFDGDGICGDTDDCPLDAMNDIDGDSFCAEVDNCPSLFNPGQSDLDSDFVGDHCDPCVRNSDQQCMFSSGFEVQ